MNTLYYGDNLDILREHLPDESVDLIYLDPPFNSKASYNILFKEPSGELSEAQITAFEDTWHWTHDTEKTFNEIMLMHTTSPKVVDMMQAFRSFVGTNDVMAYLTMMCIRLMELRRVLKETGSIYLHCDPTASHYLKILMDTIFGKKNFRNEIIWHYTGWNKKLGQHYEKRHDTILFYSKTNQQYFSPFSIPWLSKEEYVTTRKQKVCTDENGKEYVLSDRGDGKRIKRYLDEALAYGRPVDSVWEIDKLTSSATERLDYPTQKPEALLERIIIGSSKEGDTILDPFCGCGTTIAVAQRLKRKWIGIDITHLAITLIKSRLHSQFKNIKFKVKGEPVDLEGAYALSLQNRYQFQWWALSLIDARPYGDKKRGADKGIDGYIYFMEEKGKIQKVIVSVKSGKVSVKDIRDLVGVTKREKAPLGLLLTLEQPTRDMKTEAAAQGFYHHKVWDKDYPSLQILTIEELLKGKKPDLPSYSLISFKKEAIMVEDSENYKLI